MSSSRYKFRSIVLITAMFALAACGGSSSGGAGGGAGGGGTPVNQTGSVAISGTPQLGEVLTATVSDGNGTNGSMISYQWRRNGTDIPGATSSTWTAVQSDVGFTLTVNATYTDADGYSENVTSAPTANIAEIPPTDSPGSVAITGTAEVGQELTAMITDANGVTASNVTYEWRRDGTPIAGAAANSYTLVAADEGSAITVNVAYTDDDGFSGDVTSSPTATVTGPPPPTSCTGNHLINVIAATDNGQSGAGNGPDQAIDDNLDPASRWQSPGDAITITFDLGARYLVREVGIAWFEGDQRIASFSVLASVDGVNFESLLADQQSSGETISFERYDTPDTPAQYIRIENYGNSLNSDNAIIEGTAFGCTLDTPTAVFENGNVTASDFALDPTEPPGSNFELISWKLNTPADLDGNGISDSPSETDLDNGFTDEFFFTDSDGGMVFRSTIGGATTSANSIYTRSELREMLRRGNTSISTRGVTRNNWILGYQPDPGRAVGGRNGVLRATLAVNHVTETGDRNKVGRLVIGQIHAQSDEPARLYFRKYPENERGFIYLAHEIRDSDDIYFPVLGPVNSSLDNAPSDDADPANGIALNEIFSYEITQRDARIDVVVRRGDSTGPIIGHNYVDMRQQNSGYDVMEEWMYFKAGAYTQNNTGDATDFDQVTFYELENSHDM